MKEQRYLSINALTKYIKRKFDADPHLQDVLVKGEISNFKQHSSGHMYFTLKDEKARILAVMFSAQNRTMKFTPENGMKVLVRGDISVYESSGQYQIYVKEMLPDGVGALYLAYEQLKEKLEKEGLFSPTSKQSLPKYPKTVGVVTSPTGAAIRDIISTISRRYPLARILVIPALVQGQQAGPSIVRAIQKGNEISDIDVLIVGRGGGSIEELWAFNEEEVARAIFSSRKPIISAVGHETDFTIADFVADLRAPTPTGAAELAVPHIDELVDRLLNRQTRVIRAMKERVQLQRERLNRTKKSYAFRFPERMYEQKLEQLDQRTEDLKRGASRLFTMKLDEHNQLIKRLARNRPEEMVKKSKELHERLEKALNLSMNRKLDQQKRQLNHTLITLDALSPLKVMDRGYSLSYRENGDLIKSVNQIDIAEKLEVKVRDGSVICQVMDKKGSELDGVK
ncbi:exodeoxyribonuclease VII large subunit [Cytobacillus spongiae]|uniref:exodeoxyribonuclease VII large subunit n=1 Tax=Cytobacillus spongiae TaxID=2901381 RepID=UPI001F20CEA7|nr:exodeoxyribonuclease VII large subunit [Cytobacillus spongiae]UII57956.1 exodeoxyribonuclease VII large subunit [Cytobacillus spongiae]